MGDPLKGPLILDLLAEFRYANLWEAYPLVPIPSTMAARAGVCSSELKEE